jgi:hypothetical protein
MFSSNLTKFFAFFALSFLLFSACRSVSDAGGANSSATPVADDLKSEVPFAGREPARFQAEIVVTAGDTERRTFIARDGDARRWDFNFGAPNQLTNLQTDKNYLLWAARKVYTETSVGGQTAATDDWSSFLTTRWLSEKQPANFEKLETAENLTKYRVRLGDAAATEVFVYLDEKTGLPVKQEFYAVGGGEQKTLTYSSELKNLKLDADAQLFIVPADFRRVSTEEFWKLWRGEVQK